MAHSFVIGVDLGGTNIVTGAISEDGTVRLPVRTGLTNAKRGADTVADTIAEMVEASIADVQRELKIPRTHILGVGLGSPGPLDRAKGIVVVTPNLGWTNYPLRGKIEERVHLPASLDNDANCATLGEWWLGAGSGTKNLVGLTIGTGIGGGLILNGELYHGSTDAAGEIGHTTIETQGRRCNCGNYGCLEAYASGPAIAERAREALAHEDSSRLRAMVDGDLSRITAQIVYSAAAEEDALALEIVRETARFLGTGVANLLNIFNPAMVVLAGGVTQAGDRLFEPLRAEVRRRAFRPAWEAVRIVPGELAGTAGVIGAAATFLQQRRATL